MYAPCILAMPDADLRSFGRNHSLPSHVRKDCNAVSRGIRKGSNPSGRTTVRFAGASTTAAVPQNAHEDDATSGSSVVCAPQRLQTMTLRSAPQPRSRGARNAASTGFSRTLSPCGATTFSCPQYGHLSAVTPGSQCRSAPHDSHGNLRTFVVAATGAAAVIARRYFDGGGGGGGGMLLFPPSSAYESTGAQPAAPGRHACVDSATWPLWIIALSASSVYGP